MKVISRETERVAKELTLSPMGGVTEVPTKLISEMEKEN